MINFYQYVSRSMNGLMEEIELDSIPPHIIHMKLDYIRRNDNVIHKRKLCDECDGTGNYLFSSYMECPECKGEGYIE